MGRGTIYPEEWDYAWLDDYDRVMKDSKFLSGTRRASDIPPAPLSLVLIFMKEMTCVKPNEQIPDKEKNHIFVFLDYLKHKYGNETWAPHIAINFMRYLANGKYTGLEDPNLHKDLLSERDVCGNGEKTYE